MTKTRDSGRADAKDMGDNQTVVAAFDVDKTLVVRDCVFPFMTEVVGRRKMTKLLASNAPSLGRLVSARDRDGVKSLMVRAVFQGLVADEVRALGHEFAQKVAKSWIRDDVARRLRFHQRSGHRVVLVSASLDPYLVPLGDLIGVDNVLCTRLAVADDGTYTGEIDGGNCRGSAKVSALETVFGSLDQTDSRWLAYAYGDSRGDHAMIQAASMGVNVRRTTLTETC